MVDFQDAIRLARKVRRDLNKLSEHVTLEDSGLQDLYDAATQFLVAAGIEVEDD